MKDILNKLSFLIIFTFFSCSQKPQNWDLFIRTGSEVSIAGVDPTNIEQQKSFGGTGRIYFKDSSTGLDYELLYIADSNKFDKHIVNENNFIQLECVYCEHDSAYRGLTIHTDINGQNLKRLTLMHYVSPIQTVRKINYHHLTNNGVISLTVTDTIDHYNLVEDIKWANDFNDRVSSRIDEYKTDQ